MKKIKIIWIDDINGNNRKTMSFAFQDYKSKFFKGYKNEVVYEDFKEKDVSEQIETLITKYKNNKEPNIVIVDHFLDNASKGVLKRGSTVAQVLRDRGWNKCAFIGITAAQKINDVDLETESLYVVLLEARDFTRCYDKIISIAIGYNELNKFQGNRSINDLLKLIDAPDEETVKILQIIPKIINDSISKGTNISFSTSKWILHTLLYLPGFLYDELWAATILGLNSEGFEKYKKKFEKALYKGIFYEPLNPKWWSVELKQIIFNLYQTESYSYSWHLGRKLTKQHKYYSKCHKCKKDFPEIVGYIDESLSNRAPMHIGCTELLSKFENRLFFEDIRIMKIDD